MNKHMHCELIKLWAEGAPIQFKCPSSGDWINIERPSWLKKHVEYRVDPKFTKAIEAELDVLADRVDELLDMKYRIEG